MMSETSSSRRLTGRIVGIGVVAAGFVLMLIATAVSQSIPYRENPLNNLTLVGVLFWVGVLLAFAPPVYAAGKLVVDFIQRVIRLVYDRT